MPHVELAGIERPGGVSLNASTPELVELAVPS
jgi:hypothetical protein